MILEDDTMPLVLLVGKSAADRFGCATTAKQFALRVGLPGRAAEELAIAAAELASNVIRHADSGSMELRVAAQPRPHVLLVCRDRGPGIEDVAEAREDGYSSGQKLSPDTRSAGLGKGLGAIARLVDDLRIESVVGRGTTVIIRKWLP